MDKKKKKKKKYRNQGYRNYKIKRNQYELDVIKQTNFNLEDRILNFSKEKDNDLMDQVIREYLGYQSNSEVTIVYKNNQS